MSELKPCPFCGQQPELVDATRILGVWRVFHRGCPSLPTMICECFSKERAIANWNRRAPSPAVKALVEAARKLRDTINKSGNWCDSAVVENGCAWHISVAENDRLDAATDAFDEALAAVEREIGGQS